MLFAQDTKNYCVMGSLCLFVFFISEVTQQSLIKSGAGGEGYTVSFFKNLISVHISQM
jgi:hypothetical protein